MWVGCGIGTFFGQHDKPHVWCTMSVIELWPGRCVSWARHSHSAPPPPQGNKIYKLKRRQTDIVNVCCLQGHQEQISENVGNSLVFWGMGFFVLHQFPGMLQLFTIQHQFPYSIYYSLFIFFGSDKENSCHNQIFSGWRLFLLFSWS